MAVDLATVRALLEQPDDELYLDLGRELAHGERLANPPPDQELQLRAKRWLAVRRAELQGLLCNQPSLRELTDNSLNVQLAVALSGILLQFCTGVNVLTVSVLIVRAGLHQLCKDCWDAADQHG